MPAAINVASATSPDALHPRASAGSSGSSAAPEPRRREFSEVLRDTSANSRTQKANSASEDEPPGAAPPADASARPATEAVQSTAEGKAAADGAVDEAANALSAETVPPGGNELPPWLNILAEPLPPTGTPPAAIAAANVDGSMPLALVATASGTASTAAAHASAGKAAATLDTALTGRDAPAAPGGRRPASGETMAGNARAGVAIEQLHLRASTAGANGHDAELAAAVAGDTGATADRAAVTTSRFDTALALAQTSSGSTTTAHVAQAPATAAATTSIPLPLNHPHWQEAFASRVVWQVREGLQQVNVAINPPELGPIEVRMSLQDDKVSAQFVTAHHAVRQVIEDAMPRLREMLSQSGLSLADANVFQQAPGRDGQAQQFTGGAAVVEGQELAGGEEEVISQTTSSLHLGLVDAYV